MVKLPSFIKKMFKPILGLVTLPLGLFGINGLNQSNPIDPSVMRILNEQSALERAHQLKMQENKLITDIVNQSMQSSSGVVTTILSNSY